MQRLCRFPRRQFLLEYLIGICREEEALDRRFVAYADRIDRILTGFIAVGIRRSSTALQAIEISGRSIGVTSKEMFHGETHVVPF